MIALGIILWVVATVCISEMMISSAKKTNPSSKRYSPLKAIVKHPADILESIKDLVVLFAEKVVEIFVKAMALASLLLFSPLLTFYALNQKKKEYVLPPPHPDDADEDLSDPFGATARRITRELRRKEENPEGLELFMIWAKRTVILTTVLGSALWVVSLVK